MHSREATIPLKQGGALYRGSSREFCTMYESTIQGKCESGGALRGSIGVSPSNEYASRRGYILLCMSRLVAFFPRC